jgi:hypothetical protein
MRPDPGTPTWAEIELTQESCTPEQYVADMIADEAEIMGIAPPPARNRPQAIESPPGGTYPSARPAEMACAAPDEEISAGESWALLLAGLVAAVAALSAIWTAWIEPWLAQ